MFNEIVSKRQIKFYKTCNSLFHDSFHLVEHCISNNFFSDIIYYNLTFEYYSLDTFAVLS